MISILDTFTDIEKYENMRQANNNNNKTFVIMI